MSFKPASGLPAAVIVSLSLAAGMAQEPATQRLSIIGEDGFELNGAYYSQRGSRGPAVLVLHQCDRVPQALTGYEGLAQELANRGLRVLLLDSRGYGRSVDRRYTGENWREARPFFDRDTAAAYQALLERPEVEPKAVGLIAASCGGRQALTLVAERPRLKTVVLLSAAVAGPSPEARQRLMDLPTLFIASADDPFGRIVDAMRDRFLESRHPLSRLILYKGRLHGVPLLEHDPHLEGTLADWLAGRLLEK